MHRCQHHRLFITTGRKHSSLLRQWYGLGTIAAGMLGVSACLIFLQELWRACGWLLQVGPSPLSCICLPALHRSPDVPCRMQGALHVA